MGLMGAAVFKMTSNVEDAISAAAAACVILCRRREKSKPIISVFEIHEDMNPKPAKRTVRALSVQEKLLAIERVHDGESKAAVARDIGVPESTLRGWCKGEEKLRGSLTHPWRTPPPSPPDNKMPSLSDTLDAPLDFSSRKLVQEEVTCNSIPTGAPTSQTEPLLDWLKLGQGALPSMSPLEDRTPDNSSWFWKLYKNYSLLPHIIQANNKDKTQSSEEDEPPASAADAVHHGEMFLRWLECCSDPSITALQILQFRYLLNNVKVSAQRRKQVKHDRVHRRK